MWSKQKVDKLFSNFVQEQEVTDRYKKILRLSSGVRKVTIKAIRDERHNKNWVVRVTNPKPHEKKTFHFNLNKVARPNFKNGTKEMYRYVNGLCLDCGHNSFKGDLYMVDSKNYVITNVVCDICGNLHPFMFVVDGNSPRKQKDRAKEYAHKKVKNFKKKKKTQDEKNSKHNKNKREINTKKKPFK